MSFFNAEHQVVAELVEAIEHLTNAAEAIEKTYHPARQPPANRARVVSRIRSLRTMVADTAREAELCLRAGSWDVDASSQSLL